jgi:hypothetical protein
MVKSLLLLEGDLKYSSKAVKRMMAIFKHAITLPHTTGNVYGHSVLIDYKDVIFTDSNLILNGLALKCFKDSGYIKNKDIPLITGTWNKKTRKFSKTVIRHALKIPFKLLFEVTYGNYTTDPNMNGYAGLTATGVHVINMSDKNQNPEEVIIHELQHVTQQINNICLHYGKELSKLNDINDVKNIADFDFNTYYSPTDTKRLTGLGRNPLKVDQNIIIQQKDAIEQNPNLSDEEKRKALYSICNKLARKKKNSKNFNKTVAHRSNYLRYIVNTLNLDGVKIVNRENIRHLRKFTNTSRRMKHWNYSELFDVLDQKLEMQGVLVYKLNPTYTSQRCSQCGWTRKLNRKRKQFKCDKCANACDADLNASINLSLNLVSITKQERLQQKNRNGFYWNVVSKEPIVPSVQKTLHIENFQYIK